LGILFVLMLSRSAVTFIRLNQSKQISTAPASDMFVL